MRTILVTGGNSGIGLAAAEHLLASGHQVLLGCRDLSRGEAALAGLRRAQPRCDATLLELDLSSQASIRAAASKVENLDVLIHNAAFFDLSARRRQQTVEGVERIWATNYLGPVLLTEMLLPQLLRSGRGRVLAVTSKGLMMMLRLEVDLEDPEFVRRRFSVSKAYYQSKLAHLAWMLDMAERWHDSGLHFFGVRVTNVKIDLSRYPGLPWFLRAAYAIKSRFSISPAEMARTYAWLATSEDSLDSGSYWDAPFVEAAVSRWASVPRNRATLAELTNARLRRG